MSYVSLYRRFRPDTFDKVVGQEHIVKTLKNQLKNGRIGHAYLFTGTRGTGKTSCAKIFAKAVNCLSPVDGSPCNKCEMCRQLSYESNIDIIEMDAASNNGVDEIRELKENSQYPPAIAKYKVYIIDEVHMLSSSAFNALLKTLEEPPEFVIFILATTEVQKLPATILSRCMRFDFRLVSNEKLTALLKKIFDEVGVGYDDDAVRKIAAHGEGSVRDAISIADMALSYCDGFVSYADVLEILGAVDFSALNALGTAILSGDTGEALRLTNDLLSKGRTTLARDLAGYFCDLISIKNVENYKLNSVSEEEAAQLQTVAARFENYRITRAMEIICGVENAVRFSTQPKILLEASVVKACELSLDESNEAVITRIKELEGKLDGIKTGAFVPAKSNDTTLSAPVMGKADDTPKQKRAPSLLERLNGEEEEDSKVFGKPLEDSKASELWQELILKLMDAGESVLANFASIADGVLSMSDSELTITCKSGADFDMLSQENNRNLINNVIKEIKGADFCFTVKLFGREAEQTVPVETVTELERMFGGRFGIQKDFKKK